MQLESERCDKRKIGNFLIFISTILSKFYVAYLNLHICDLVNYLIYAYWSLDFVSLVVLTLSVALNNV